MGKKIYFLLSIFIMCLLVTPAYAFVWWTGTPDFVINDTADWDAGTKGVTDEAWNVETVTDNFANIENTIGLANFFGDRWTYPVDDAFNRKWRNATNYNTAGSGINATFNITYPQTYHQRLVATSHNYRALDNRLDNDVAAEVRVQHLENSSTLGYSTLWFILNASYYTRIQVQKAGTTFSIQGYSMCNGASNSSGTTVSPIDIEDIKLKVERNGDEFQSFYDIGGGWIKQTNKTCTATRDGEIVIQNSGIIAGVWSARWTDFNVTDGIFVDDYYSKSGSWTSPVIDVPHGQQLKNITLNITAPNPTYNVTQVEFLKGDGTVVAVDYDDLYTTGLHTITNSSLDVGTFELLNGANNLRVKVVLAGEGDYTPYVEDIIGYFETGSGTYCSTYILAKRVLW